MGCDQAPTARGQPRLARVLPRQEPGTELRALAQHQQGVVTAGQAAASGLSVQALYRLERTERWRRLDRGVYFTGAGEPPWEAWGRAGVLLGGESARLGGTAAGYLHGMVGSAPSRITVLVPSWAVTRSRGRWQFRREGDGVRGASVGSLPRTSVEDTLLDLSALAAPARVVGLVTEAVGSRRTTAPLLRAALDRRRRVRHRELLADLLVDVALGVESPLELRYLRDVERAHRLPPGERQDRSALPFRRDVVYRGFGLVVELDGRLGHEGAGRFRDMSRDNRTVLGGELTLRYGTVDVAAHPCAVARQVEAALRLRGWSGCLLRCPRCPALPGQAVNAVVV